MHGSIGALAALLAIAASLAACGGGDGEPPAAPGPVAPPASQTPLAITAATAAGVAALAPGVGDSVLALAHFSADAVRQFSLPGQASPAVSTCPNGGLLTVALVDRDGNGVASVGDRVSVQARDCGVPVLADVVAGTVQIDLLEPAGLPAGSLRAAVGFADGLRFGDATAGTAKLLGSLQFDWSSTAVQTVVHVTASAADDLRVTVPGSPSVTESIRRPDLKKTLQYDQARAVVAMSYRYDSEALQGSLSVSTPEPLQAYLGTFPEIGRIDVVGAAGSRLTLTPNFVSQSNQFQYALDSNGDGTADAQGSVAWSDSVDGHLWWDGISPVYGWAPGAYVTRTFATTDFFATTAFDWRTSGTSSVRLQFSRPLASTTPMLFFRFADQGPATAGDAPRMDIAGTGEVHGALVVVRPAEPLRHGRSYALQVSQDGTNWFGSVTVQDALGNSSSSYAWSGMSLTTPDTLRALAAVPSGMLAGAADQLVLDGRASRSTARPIVAYRWTQVSGTALRFGDAAAAQTVVSWGDRPPTGAERAVVRLTVTDSAGDTDAIDLTVLSAELGAARRVLYFRSADGDYVGAGATNVLLDSQAQFWESHVPGYFSLSANTPDYRESWSLYLGSADGLPLHAGAYENAQRWSSLGSHNGLAFSGGGRGCSLSFGRFDVIEIETDGSGAITRLAVDFEQRCDSATAPALLGSYRVNSSVPIRR